ncbi:MAG: YceI-like protein [Acidimicrobiales bacterium]|nr:YceI-like protein [Acidimicrobiales bacterium]
MGAQDDGGEAAASDGAPEVAPRRRGRRLRWLPFPVVLLSLGVVGVVAWRQVAPVVSARKYRDVTYTVPAAPKLTAAGGETVYRIDPTLSSLGYRIGEQFAGKKASTATGVTNGLAGDIALDAKNPNRARVGQVVANVEQFHSDNNLRDARLRQDFLKSHEFPLAHFTVTSIKGLPAALTDGQTYPLTMTGTATIKQTTAPLVWQATASLHNGKLTATATTTTKLSTFKVGPISLAGLVTTSDDVTLTLKLIARDPTKYAIPTHITGPHAKATTGGPSFQAAVMPILERSCASCHNPGQVGSEHWQLSTAGDAAAIADGIKTVTETKYMPPWPASEVGVPLAHRTTLSTAQLDVLSQWAKAGGPLDVATSTPVKPAAEIKALLPRKDVSLYAPTYTGSTSNPNDYRCFVLDPKLTTPMYLTGYSFLAGQIAEIHHVQVFHVTAAQKANAPTVEGKDGKPGWECYGGPGLRGARRKRVPGAPRTAPTGTATRRDVGFAGQPDLVAGWVPGQLPAIYPLHSGILLQPGDALVLQIHYHYDPVATADRSGLALQLDPVSSKVRAMRVVNPLGPVEIPCAPGATAPLCDRNASLAAYEKQFGGSGSGNEAGLLALCNRTPAGLTAGFTGTVARSNCDLVVPEDGTITAVLGHMHTLGKSIRMTLDPGTPQQKVLLDIPNWNFGWQMNYELATPIHVKAGQPLRLDCSWDRSLDPKRPQKYIVFAEGTEDEMCFGTYALIPDHQ